MTMDLSWRTSSYSGTQENCVEVAFATETVGFRDSKNTTGPALFFSRSAFATFLIGATS